jgi:hypothetical protein
MVSSKESRVHGARPLCRCHVEPMDWRGRSRPNGWSCAVARRARQNAKRAERYHANWEAENYARFRRRLRARIAFKSERYEELLARLPDTDVFRTLKEQRRGEPGSRAV